MTDQSTPTVEMLWEPADARAVLAERFGFPTAEAAAAWATATVGRHWDIEVTSCDRIVLSFKNALAWLRTADGPVLAKWSIATHRFAHLAELAELTAWLARHGLPVSAPIPATDGRPQLEVDGVSLGLQRVMPGELLDVGDPVQVHEAGATLALLHERLASYPLAESILALPRPKQALAARISGWLDDVPTQVPHGARDRLRRLVAGAPTAPLPAQLVHGDFRAANILRRRQRMTAVLDFEEAGFDHRIVDLARGAVLLGTCFHDWGPVTPEVRAGFREAYESVSQLTPDEAAWWDPLVLWFTLTMIPDGDDPTDWAASAAELTHR